MVKKLSIYIMLFVLSLYTFAYPLSLQSMYGLVNETPPGVVSLGQGGFFVSGGGVYIRPSPQASSGNIFTATPPTLNAACGSLDMFLGGIGFGGFSLLVQKFQAILMALPIVAFKIALAILAPQVSTILDNIERITDALNNMQIGQCGQIHGLDVHAITSAIGNIKGAVTQMMSQNAVQNAKNFYEQVSDNGNWDIGKVVQTWNQLVSDSWQQLGQIFDVNGTSINFAADPSLMDNAVKQLVAEGVFPSSVSLYTDPNVEGFVRYLIGDIDMGAVKAAAAGTNPHGISVYIPGFPQDIVNQINSLNDCGTVNIVSSSSTGISANPVAYTLSSGSGSSCSGLGCFCYQTFLSNVQSLYSDIQQGTPLSNADRTTAQLLASIRNVPALATIEWAAIVSSAYGVGTNDPLSRYINNQVTNALAMEVIDAFFTNYISQVTREMSYIVHAIASGKIATASSGSSSSSNSTALFARYVNEQILPDMNKISKDAGTAVLLMHRSVNQFLEAEHVQLSSLVNREGQLRNQAFTILKNMGLYNTYLRAAGLG